jgi:Protein of unknown function (DUF2934)
LRHLGARRLPDGKNLAHWLQAEAEIKSEEIFGPMMIIRKNVSDHSRMTGFRFPIKAIRKEILGMFQ